MGGYRLIDTLTAIGSEHENTVTEAVLDGASFVFPANFFVPGKVIKWECLIEVIDSNSTDTLATVVYLGPTTLTTAVASFGAVDAADADCIHLMGTIQAHDVDGSGTLVSIVEGSDLAGSGETEGTETHFSRQTTIDFTAALRLEIGVDWSVAHADNEVACVLWYVTEVTS